MSDNKEWRCLFGHASDCPVHNGPAYPAEECNCGYTPEEEPIE